MENLNKPKIATSHSGTLAYGGGGGSGVVGSTDVQVSCGSQDTWPHMLRRATGTLQMNNNNNNNMEEKQKESTTKERVPPAQKNWCVGACKGRDTVGVSGSGSGSASADNGSCSLNNKHNSSDVAVVNCSGSNAGCSSDERRSGPSSCGGSEAKGSVASAAVTATATAAAAAAAAVAGGQLIEKQNGCSASIFSPDLPVTNFSHPKTVAIPESVAVAVAVGVSSPNEVTPDNDIYAIGAASLSPPRGGDGGDGSSNLHSNHSGASVNNSSENLSYSSENYYHDDLILLEEDDDIDAEEVSLNSDDCIYAYRGDGADFDLILDPVAGGRGDGSLMDDETDFLEMDFEPDPPSEVELYYNSSVAASTAAAVAAAAKKSSPSDDFLRPEGSCNLSGRRSVTAMSLNTMAMQRQHFSSPIDDDLPPPPKALQSQSMLSKNIACITLHLDQIKGGENGDCDVFEGGAPLGGRASVMGGDLCDTPSLSGLGTSTAHSLPNTLLTNFGRDLRDKQETKSSPSKVTGAKPKRLSTFSTSSSTSSKNSSKSRNSLRSSFAPVLCNSSSFDERSVSCTEFRSVPPPDDCVPNVVANTAANAVIDEFSTNDETCLDCLEKEFLANTIGKIIDPNECPKCRRRAGGSRVVYTRLSSAPAGRHTRCRSGSPSLFGELGRDESIFEVANDFLNVRRKEDSWTMITPPKSKTSIDVAVTPPMARSKDMIEGDDMTKGHAISDGYSGMNQRRATCDNLYGEHLLKNLLLTEREIVTIPTLNLNEEMLVQALEKLHVTYNTELIRAHFRTDSSMVMSMEIAQKNVKEYKNLKHFLLHESKKNCNHPKIRRLIELATRHQVEVVYKKDMKITETEMISVNVADILSVWTLNKDLEILKQLDKRFMEANVLGKIANVIRQAQQRCTPRRPLPDYISIPQYYASGYLTLTKKC